MRTKLPWMVIGLLTFLIILMGGVIVFLFINLTASPAAINSFEDCAKTNPVMESYPRQCRTPDGRLFVEEVPPVNTTTPAPTITGEPKNSNEIDVYFSNYIAAETDEFRDDLTAAFPLKRQSNRTDIPVFAIEQLIDGPDATERAAGYYTPIDLSGISNCNSKDFNLKIKDGRATLKFCRNMRSAGTGDDARIIGAITKTLKQFSTVTKVTILTQEDHCFGDESGLELCKN